MLGNDILRLGDCTIGIAALDVLVCLHVVLVLFKHQRGVLRLGLFDAADGGQYFVLHLHQLAGAIGGLHIHSADQGNTVAQIVGDLTHTDQRGLILLNMTHIYLTGNVLLGQHSHHTLQRLRLGDIDGQHTGTGILRTDGNAVAHTIHIHIVGILTVAQHLLLYIEAVDTAAHLPVILRRNRQLALAEDLASQQNGVNDLHITGAAADIVADSKGCLFTGGVIVHIQHRLGRDHHTGDAEAALDSARLAESEGVDLLLPIAQALHRLDGLPFQLIGLRNACLGGLAVNEDVARAASTLAAAVLDGGQMQFIAEKTNQLLILLHGNTLAVHNKSCHLAALLLSTKMGFRHTLLK